MLQLMRKNYDANLFEAHLSKQIQIPIFHVTMHMFTHMESSEDTTKKQDTSKKKLLTFLMIKGNK